MAKLIVAVLIVGFVVAAASASNEDLIEPIARRNSDLHGEGGRGSTTSRMLLGDQTKKVSFVILTVKKAGNGGGKRMSRILLGGHIDGDHPGFIVVPNDSLVTSEVGRRNEGGGRRMSRILLGGSSGIIYDSSDGVSIIRPLSAEGAGSSPGVKRNEGGGKRMSRILLADSLSIYGLVVPGSERHPGNQFSAEGVGSSPGGKKNEGGGKRMSRMLLRNRKGGRSLRSAE